MSLLPDDFWPLAEASRQTGFSRNSIERRSEHRTEELVAEALADPNALTLVFNHDGRLLFDPAGSPWQPREQVEHLSAPGYSQRLLLGWMDGTPRHALQRCDTADDPPDPYKAIDVRSIYAQGLLIPADEGALGQARSLLNWHGGHRHCGFCGHATEIAGGGIKRACPSCGREVFPRIDPVAIMLVTDGERALLGRSAHFPEGMYSCLAGFVEHGETLEDTVRREVLEESGITVGAVRYHASQPWPMPHTLMMGFFGKALSSEIQFDETELADCRWFSRDEMIEVLSRRPAYQSTEPSLPGGTSAPPRGAIAARLMADWVALTAH
ncbi:NAD(+) diphosphatase [Notoacmeibacter sp. MSK16QG-6]|uniref:NAD(+) diphosphatase n=1 Tax=Notoacmeibacter sp. MSK16QG-6 TaxID=2957982 RepID=UPI0020A18D36|nr:NAD(+) diphosphatase [Notoacmeibacter sp. MSK16QG-6]MCP1198744.1 NAD(+) diphosphatase [Notoacmeibacter sp. MSK16QG-6]